MARWTVGFCTASHSVLVEPPRHQWLVPDLWLPGVYRMRVWVEFVFEGAQSAPYIEHVLLFARSRVDSRARRAAHIPPCALHPLVVAQWRSYTYPRTWKLAHHDRALFPANDQCPAPASRVVSPLPD